MEKKDQAKKECMAYEGIRDEFFNLFDTQLPKDKNKLFDFENQTLEAKKVYELFYKLDYQARKLRGLVVEGYGLKAE